MLRQISALLPEELGKSLLVALILITPGSFLVLPVLALFRLCARHGCYGAIQQLRGYWVSARIEMARRFGRSLTQTGNSVTRP